MASCLFAKWHMHLSVIRLNMQKSFNERCSSSESVYMLENNMAPNCRDFVND